MNFMKTAVASGVLALVFTATASAQILRASVPFSFAAGDRVLPAGDYRMVVDRAHGCIEIQSIEGREQMYLIYMFPIEARDLAPALVFASYGDAHFLRTVRATGVALELSTSKTERGLAKERSRSTTEVALHRDKR